MNSTFHQIVYCSTHINVTKKYIMDGWVDAHFSPSTKYKSTITKLSSFILSILNSLTLI